METTNPTGKIAFDESTKSLFLGIHEAKSEMEKYKWLEEFETQKSYTHEYYRFEFFTFTQLPHTQELANRYGKYYSTVFAVLPLLYDRDQNDYYPVENSFPVHYSVAKGPTDETPKGRNLVRSMMFLNYAREYKEAPMMQSVFSLKTVHHQMQAKNKKTVLLPARLLELEVESREVNFDPNNNTYKAVFGIEAYANAYRSHPS